MKRRSSIVGVAVGCCLLVMPRPTVADEASPGAGTPEVAERAESGDSAAGGSSKEKLASVVDLGTGASTGARRWTGPPVTLSLRDADLVEVLRSLAKIAGVNLMIDPKVSGSVTLELRDVPVDQAFYVILKSQGLGAEQAKGIARVRTVR